MAAQLVTVISDDTGAQSQFLSPTILEAAYGISQAILAAISRTGMVLAGSEGKIKVPEKLQIKLYRAQVREDGKRVESHTVQRMFEAKLEFVPKRFEGLKRAPDNPESREDVGMEDMVKLT